MCDNFRFLRSNAESPHFFTSLANMFCNTFNLNNMVTFQYKFQIITKFCFCNIQVIFENPCNIDFAIFGLFLRLLETSFLQYLLQKITCFATFFNVAKKCLCCKKKHLLRRLICRNRPDIYSIYCIDFYYLIISHLLYSAWFLFNLRED